MSSYTDITLHMNLLAKCFLPCLWILNTATVSNTGQCLHTTQANLAMDPTKEQHELI